MQLHNWGDLWQTVNWKFPGEKRKRFINQNWAIIFFMFRSTSLSSTIVQNNMPSFHTSKVILIFMVEKNKIKISRELVVIWCKNKPQVSSPSPAWLMWSGWISLRMIWSRVFLLHNWHLEKNVGYLTYTFFFLLKYTRWFRLLSIDCNSFKKPKIYTQVW